MDNNKRTILIVEIVEDEATLTKALKDKFEREGFGVITANNGAQGLTTALEKCPDLILIDVVMPIMDGMTMLKKSVPKMNGAKVVEKVRDRLTKTYGQES